jgi:hypothetical protein
MKISAVQNGTLIFLERILTAVKGSRATEFECGDDLEAFKRPGWFSLNRFI